MAIWEQVPALVVLVVLTLRFLQHLRERDLDYAAVMREVAKELGENRSAVRELLEHLKGTGVPGR